MAKEKNKRLIPGKYERLSAEEKKRAVKITDDYYIIYPMELAKNMFDIKDELKAEKTSQQERERDEARNKLKLDETENDFVTKNTTTSKFIVKGTSVLSKDWRFCASASPEMEWVRKSLAALNNLLDEGLKKYIKENGIFDGKEYLKTINTAYDEFIEAAQNYVDSRNPSTPPGKRRKNQVAALLNFAKKSRLDINNIIDAVKDGAIDFSQMDEATKNGLNSWNLVEHIEAREADGKVEWQNEGNSTDVYKLQLKAKDGINDGMTYYLKENLPFLNENMLGFCNRRFKQLQKSQENRGKNDPEHPEEQRLLKISADDYEFGRRLLSNLAEGINKAGDADKDKVSQKYAGYFAYNFDDIFREMEFYNKAADFKPQHANLTIDQLIEQADDKKDKLLAEALRHYKRVLKA